jgi:hypothetical protein
MSKVCAIIEVPKQLRRFHSIVYVGQSIMLRCCCRDSHSLLQRTVIYSVKIVNRIRACS